jgi:KipI family sensor histidine kinase inhibitor
MDPLRFAQAGDSALLVELPSRIDRATSGRVVALARLATERLHGRVRDVVVGYCSLTVYFDPLEEDAAALAAELQEMDAHAIEDIPVEGRAIHVDVCYGGEYGPDMAEVAAYAGGSEAEVVALHTAVSYRVYMLGFIPGFAYMASVHPRLALPRRPTPRVRVPAGSVAIAAGQTGIYSLETPGGWHVIGRTRAAPYDPARSEPFLFTPGDQVTFRAVSRAEFDRVDD